MAADLRIAALVSGSGTTMYMVGQAINLGTIKGVELALCIASKPGIGALERAKELHIPDAVIERRNFPSSEEFGKAMLDVMDRWRIDRFVHLGWMPKTPRNVVEAFSHGRALNQHPGSPEYFGGKGMYGIRVHAAVLRYHQLAKTHDWERWTEVVAQLVAPDYDEGKVLVRTQVPICPDDTPETLQARALPYEWATQITALQWFAWPDDFPRNTPQFFIPDSQKPQLEEAKAWAIQQYPHS